MTRCQIHLIEILLNDRLNAIIPGQVFEQLSDDTKLDASRILSTPKIVM